MSSAGELVCDDLTKSYGTKKLALDSVSFTVPTKGIFTLIGRNLPASSRRCSNRPPGAPA